VRADAPQLAAFLHHASIVELGRERVVIAFEAGSVFEKSAKAPDSVELIRKAARAHLGGEPALVFETTTAGTSGKTVAAAESRERSERQREALARAKQHPKLAEVAQILGARLKEIRLPDE
jgi:hypothetical protein